MKIYGIGIDIVNISRIKKNLINNKSFKMRIFTKKEILFCESKKNKYECYSKRFAAKEAFSKALGTGISKGISFNEIEINNDLMGKPGIRLIKNTLKVVKKTFKNHNFRVFLTMSDDKPFAVANIVISI
jgi:holo-[acyl-carrier protein] synthase|tara:strand:- start:595 stop:981 length:387 start_codon:yes stop_codon:yes gene_type:complete